MNFIPIKTRVFQPPKEDLFEILDQYLPKIEEKDIIFIASKVVAISEERCVKADEKIKNALIKKEAEKMMEGIDPGFFLTIKQNTMIANAGIDESNGGEYLILWPKDSFSSARKIRNYLKEKHQVKNLAVIITDSHTTPMRRGVIGISIGFDGINPLLDHRGKKDLFNREINVSQSNVVDALTATAVLKMGESNESTPIVILKNAEVEFSEKDYKQDFRIPFEEDLFYPLLKYFDLDEV
ncbi:MAG: coenzyme F420-0:L-glutamate ligase [Minisyncoccales bacterium]